MGNRPHAGTDRTAAGWRTTTLRDGIRCGLPASTRTVPVAWYIFGTWRPDSGTCQRTQKARKRIVSGPSSWWRGQDLNLRPSGYEPDELPDCSTPRRSGCQLYGQCLRLTTAAVRRVRGRRVRVLDDLGAHVDGDVDEVLGDRRQRAAGAPRDRDRPRRQRRVGGVHRDPAARTGRRTATACRRRPSRPAPSPPRCRCRWCGTRSWA